MPREHWRPKKKEIDEQFEKQVQEFAMKENRSMKLMVEKWKNKYIFTEVYENFFVTFVNKIQEWLARLIDFQTCWKDERVTQWTPKLIEQLEKTDNTIARMVDHWVDSVIGQFGCHSQ